jgi:RimJ/RimL family protein N-acetyltransferase
VVTAEALTLQDSKIRLVPFAEEHLADVAEMIEDRDVLRFTRVPEPPPANFPRAWLARYVEGRRDGTREAFAIVDTTDGRFCGLAVAPRIDRVTRTVELGYVVAPHARGRGVATAALRLLTRWAFTELHALRLELLISLDNEASKRVAENVGYVREGVLRSLHFKQDRWEDSEIWSRLPTDP